MDKMTLPSFDEKAVSDYIKEIQALFPKENVNLNNVNDFSLMHEERKNCLNCKGLSECKNHEPGHLLHYQNGEFQAVECKFRREESQKRNSLIKTLYLPEHILDAKLEDYHTESESRKKIYKHILDFTGNFGSDDFSKGLYLYGSFAKGKTYTLAVIANELAKKNIGCLLIYFPDLVLDLKNAIGTPRFDSLINMLKDIDVLMLDDMGSENMTAWVRDEILGPVINYRMMAEKPLYISSNLNPNDLVKHLSIDGSPSGILKGQRIASRMSSLLASVDMDDSESYKR